MMTNGAIMTNRCGCFSSIRVRFGMIATGGAAVLLMAAVMIGSTPPAEALPSFARQTGQPCGTCHTDFPFLTPFGRRFKLLGYTTGGGPYRTTPFSNSRSAADSNAQLRSYAGRI